jgi:hypothetical protein
MNKELKDFVLSRYAELQARESKLPLLDDSYSTLSDDCTVPLKYRAGNHRPVENQGQKKQLSQPETNNTRSASKTMVYFMGRFVGGFTGGMVIGIAIGIAIA